MARQAIFGTYVSIGGNLALAVAKWLAGFFGNSHALIADAIESTTDVFSSILVLLGLKYATRPADKNHPYGHGRIEPLVTFVIVCLLVVSAVLIAVESVRNLQLRHKPPAAWTLAVLAAIVVIKEIFYRIITKKARETNSSSLMADAWHHRSDAITSLTAFAGIMVATIGGPGYEKADDIAALVAAAVILYNSYRIFRPALGELMDEHLYDDLVAKIRESSVHVPGVIDTEKCYIRKAGLGYFVDLHVVVDPFITVAEGHDIAHALKAALRKNIPGIIDILIHVEPGR